MKTHVILVVIGTMILSSVFAQTSQVPENSSMTKEESFFNNVEKDQDSSITKEVLFFNSVKKDQEDKQKKFEAIQKEASLRQQKQIEVLDQALKHLNETIQKLEVTKASVEPVNKFQARQIGKQIKMIEEQKKIVEEQRKSIVFFNVEEPFIVNHSDSMKYEQQYEAEILNIKEDCRKAGYLKMNINCPLSELFQLNKSTESKEFTFEVKKGEITKMVLYLYGELSSGFVDFEVVDAKGKTMANLHIDNFLSDSKSSGRTYSSSTTSSKRSSVAFWSNSRSQQRSSTSYSTGNSKNGKGRDSMSAVSTKYTNGALIKTINEPHEGEWTIRMVSKDAVGVIKVEVPVIQSYKINE